MPTNREGLGINATQPFTHHKRYHVTPKGLLTLPPSKGLHFKKRKIDHNLLPNPRVYYGGVLKKFHPRNNQATALCPFHPDKNPSFSVNLRQGKFFCFSCGASGGDIIDFHQHLHGINFVKAVTELGAWDYE